MTLNPQIDQPDAEYPTFSDRRNKRCRWVKVTTAVLALVTLAGSTALAVPLVEDLLREEPDWSQIEIMGEIVMPAPPSPGAQGMGMSDCE